MRALPPILILLAVLAVAWLLRSSGEDRPLDDATLPVRGGGDGRRDDARLPPPTVREETSALSEDAIGLLDPNAPEARGPDAIPPGVLVRLPPRPQGGVVTGRQVLEAVARVVPVRARTQKELRALEAVRFDADWADRPDPVPLEEILDIWRGHGVDVRPQGRVLVVVDHREEVEEPEDDG